MSNPMKNYTGTPGAVYWTSPVRVEAFRFGTESEFTAPAWFTAMVDEERVFIDQVLEDGSVRTYGCTIKTAQGKLKAKNGDYIIRDKQGDITVMRPEVFEKRHTTF